MTEKTETELLVSSNEVLLQSKECLMTSLHLLRYLSVLQKEYFP